MKRYQLKERVRATIELRAEHLEKLRELAARRKEKGYSKLIGEALDAFFANPADDAERRAAVEATCGMLSEEKAEALRAAIREGRKRPWSSSTPTS